MALDDNGIAIATRGLHPTLEGVIVEQVVDIDTTIGAFYDFGNACLFFEIGWRTNVLIAFKRQYHVVCQFAFWLFGNSLLVFGNC